MCLHPGISDGFLVGVVAVALSNDLGRIANQAPGIVSIRESIPQCYCPAVSDAVLVVKPNVLHGHRHCYTRVTIYATVTRRIN